MNFNFLLCGSQYVVWNFTKSQNFFFTQSAPKTPIRDHPKSKSPSRGAQRETVVTKRTIVTSVVSSSSGQEEAAHTPVRSSSRIASLIEREVCMSRFFFPDLLRKGLV